MRISPSTLTLAVVAALTLAGCGGQVPEPRTSGSPDPSITTADPPRDATAALALWRSIEPERYRYTIEYSCFCATYGRWQVEVEDGVVTRTRTLDDQHHPGGEPNEYVRPIDELLADAERAESGEAGAIEATYDAGTGVPTHVSIDWITNAIDDEISWEIEDFSPR